ncbi:Uncharacterised protein [Mycobacteroides abscessus subsp. abscessus]|nr:Uncharacterised protein [Mycobacteroides abscessus subsp. abscessus]
MTVQALAAKKTRRRGSSGATPQRDTRLQARGGSVSCPGYASIRKVQGGRVFGSYRAEALPGSDRLAEATPEY